MTYINKNGSSEFFDFIVNNCRMNMDSCINIIGGMMIRI